MTLLVLTLAFIVGNILIERCEEIDVTLGHNISLLSFTVDLLSGLPFRFDSKGTLAVRRIPALLVQTKLERALVILQFQGAPVIDSIASIESSPNYIP